MASRSFEKVSADILRQSGRTGLIEAANSGQTETVLMLLDKGANVNAIDEVRYRGQCSSAF